jgi:lipopolysaccharide export system protein LptA
MRSYRLTRLTSLALALLAVFAFGAVMAAAAQAEEAPFISVEGVRLASGSTREVTVKLFSANSTLTAGTTVVTCTKVEVKAGAKLIGSNAGEAATGEATLRYSGCTVTGNGSPCEVTKEEVETKPLRGELVEDAATKKKLLVDFLPASGNVFAELKFTGSGCKFTVTKVTGKDVLLEVKTDPKEEIVELPGPVAEAESWLGEVEVPQPTSFWLVKGGTGKLVDIEEAEGLEAFGVPATLKGTYLLLLAKEGKTTKEKWSPLP